MRNLIRQSLTWMVIAECFVVALLIVVVWNVDAPSVAPTPTLPDLTEAAGPAVPPQLPGLNLDAGFWRLRLNQLNRDQVFFEQLEWGLVHNAMDAAQGYLDTVVLPSITHAERA